MTESTETPAPEASRPLNVPEVEHVEYQRNFIRTAVCEFRFPTLLAWEAAPPAQFQALIRRDYPTYQRGTTVSLQPGALQPQEATYKFISKNLKWAISLKASSATLETSEYTNYEEFAARVRPVLEALEKVIDSDFYTRIGLRYVNVLPVDQRNLSGWISADLSPALVAGVFGDTDHCWTEIGGRTTAGGYILRYGFAEVAKKREYVLDTDFFGDVTECKVARKVLGELNADSFRLFSWCIGEKTRAAMGRTSPKERKK